MKLKKGERSYWLPPTGRIVDVVLDTGSEKDPNAPRFLIEQVHPMKMAEIVAEAKGEIPEGIPTLCCVRASNDTAHSHMMDIYPAPDSDHYQAIIRFYPPMLVA